MLACSRQFAVCLLMLALLGIVARVGPADAADGKFGACDLGGTRIQSVPDPVSGRSYDIEVTLPSDYEAEPARHYPVLYYADGGHLAGSATCLAKEPQRLKALKSVKRLRREGKLQQEPILIGLSYAKGEGFATSRGRDYTPVAAKPGYGGAEAYRRYLAETVIPHVESLYRIDPARRLFWGHSYGGLLGAHVLLTSPELFHSYILGSPSFWFGDHAILDMEANYAERDLKANVLIYVGGDEIRRYDPARRGYTQDMVGDVRTFEKRVKARGFPGLTIRSLVVPQKNHRTTIPPGFGWAITSALGGE